ncbi:hypothetical protein F4806DRAFT_505048 [Annulohypoxylon nitens]|nr:hypothetical protein F4806DRAFT_505048 [Annulohypoxylon nitens]
MRSMVKWDGISDLPSAVCRLLGLQKDSSTGQVYQHCANEPSIIRVHYRSPDTDAPKFQQLRTFSVADKRTFTSLLETGGSGAPRVNRGGPLAKARRESGSNYKWTFGEPNREYMLYYCQERLIRRITSAIARTDNTSAKR